MIAKMLGKKVQLSQEVQQYFCSEMVKALYHLHTNEGVAHCDVKPENYVLTSSCTLALIDFGASKNMSEVGIGYTGTEINNPPEIYTRSSYENEKVDIFQLGVAISVLLNQ